MRRLAPLLGLGFWLAAGSVQAATTDPRTLIEAPLLPEGSGPEAATVTALADPGDSLLVDLGRSVGFRALLLQADGNDVYWVEASENGDSWDALWRVPAAYGPPGLRTRSVVLDAEHRARFLRVRATSGDGRYAVARLRAFAQLPRPWPPLLDTSLPNGPLPPWPKLTPTATGTLQGGIAVLGLAAALLSLARPRFVIRARVLLGLAAALSALAWVNFGNFRYHSVAHAWDVYHYYVGAKYFPELGYDHLYDCAAVAQAEDEGTAALADRRIRDLTTNTVVFASDALTRPELCRGRFTPPRWSAFRDDVRVFRGLVGSEWANAQLDHGFNATPVWTVAGRLVASAVPATPRGIAVLLSFDFILITLALALIFAGFGFEAGCVALIFFGTNTLSRFAWTGGAFLRFDWFFLSVAGLWALRRERYGLAGFALVYATLLRVFPGVLLLGLGLQAASELLRHRARAPLAHLKGLALGGGLALLLLLPAAAALSGGVAAWQAFAANSRKYLATEAGNRLGLATALAYSDDLRQALTFDPQRPDTFEAWSAGQRDTLARRRWLLHGLEAAYLALIAWGCRGHKPWVAAVVAAGLLPILFRMANYYYAFLTLCAALAALNPAFGVGLALLTWGSHLATSLWPAYDERAAALSVLAVVFAFWIAARVARDENRLSP